MEHEEFSRIQAIAEHGRRAKAPAELVRELVGGGVEAKEALDRIDKDALERDQRRINGIRQLGVRVVMEGRPEHAETVQHLVHHLTVQGVAVEQAAELLAELVATGRVTTPAGSRFEVPKAAV